MNTQAKLQSPKSRGIVEIKIKPTNKNLGEFYGLTRQTIATYKQKKENLYKAMLEYFLKTRED